MKDLDATSLTGQLREAWIKASNSGKREDFEEAAGIARWIEELILKERESRK